MSETSCWIGLFSKFVKFYLVKSGNRQGISHTHNVVQGANLSLIKRSKMQSTARMRRRFSALSLWQTLWHPLALPLAFFWIFARLSPRLALQVNDLEPDEPELDSLRQESVDGVFVTEICIDIGNSMLNLRQKQAKVLLSPKTWTKMVWWTRDHVKSVWCHGDVENSGQTKSYNPLDRVVVFTEVTKTRYSIPFML